MTELQPQTLSATTAGPEVVDELVRHFDHHDPRLGSCVDAVYARMRSECPVAHSDKHGGFWTLSSYETVHYAMQHYELFATAPSVNIPAGLGQSRPLLPMEVDPPVQSRYRALLLPVFSPGRMKSIEGHIREVTDSLIDSFIDDGECEFVGDFAEKLPTVIFTGMMGLPLDQAARFHDWKNTLLHGHHDDTDGTIRRRAGEELNEYLAELLADRKQHPGEDIISTLHAAEVDGDKLTDEEILDMTYLLFLAGLDTVTSSLGLQFLRLAQRPDLRDQIVADPAIIPLAVEEMLRVESLILAGRTATQDVEIGGQLISKGDRVLINTVAADRDPAMFDDPDEIRFDRGRTRHVAFGVGPHRCPGSHLARIELAVAYEHWHRRIPTYRLKEGARIVRYASSVAGVAALPLVWDR
ncbi:MULTISPECIES: cytochrome P450 [Mycolicibacter]|uniref:Cytochrome P450 n=1 Tax=Mycolicibacter kumamotonensis TaxID=354243 RepID=A0A7K3L790_9MYCO|nr:MULTISPECIES: cytochrome P450 [Mycolicibacter]NDJ88132.1 cytochrome P450 [Mycolicibacter kumamotonensis]RAV03856.1 cytochrome P450 [Mycolicibacter senuensis]